MIQTVSGKRAIPTRKYKFGPGVPCKEVDGVLVFSPDATVRNLGNGVLYVGYRDEAARLQIREG